MSIEAIREKLAAMPTETGKLFGVFTATEMRLVLEDVHAHRGEEARAREEAVEAGEEGGDGYRRRSASSSHNTARISPIVKTGSSGPVQVSIVGTFPA